jgi:hypothetical protein
MHLPLLRSLTLTQHNVYEGTLVTTTLLSYYYLMKYCIYIEKIAIVIRYLDKTVDLPEGDEDATYSLSATSSKTLTFDLTECVTNPGAEDHVAQWLIKHCRRHDIVMVFWLNGDLCSQKIMAGGKIVWQSPPTNQ